MMNKLKTSDLDDSNTVVRSLELSVKDESGYARMEEIFKALASELRLSILNEIAFSPRKLGYLAEKYGLSNSNLLFHINILKKAGLVLVDYEPSIKGFRQIVYPSHIVSVNIDLRGDASDSSRRNKTVVDMPVGNYCDIAGDEIARYILPGGRISDKNEVFMPGHNDAMLVWIYKAGHITYNFPGVFTFSEPLGIMEFELELCSEAPFYNSRWKSSIDFYVNGLKLCTFISPGDFGERPGKLNPSWWPSGMTQYGLYVKISVDENGTYLNGEPCGTVNISDIDATLKICKKTQLKIEVSENSEFTGGINLFGRNCGDFPVDIRMTAYSVKYIEIDKERNKIDYKND